MGNTLEIQSGTLTFNPLEFNPELSNFVVTAIVAGEDVPLNLTGDLKEPQLTLSDKAPPGMTMDDVLTYLTINQRVTEGVDLSRAGFVQPVQSYVLGALVTQQGEKILKQTFGLDYLDIQNPTLGTTASDTSRILVGQRLSKNLKMTYQRDILRAEQNPVQKLNVEYRVNQNMSITGGVDQDGLFNIKGIIRYTY